MTESNQGMLSGLVKISDSAPLKPGPIVLVINVTNMAMHLVATQLEKTFGIWNTQVVKRWNAQAKAKASGGLAIYLATGNFYDPKTGQTSEAMKPGYKFRSKKWYDAKTRKFYVTGWVERI